MNPWRPTNIAATVHTYERNPFFWQVDTGGNQLPYIDNVVSPSRRRSASVSSAARDCTCARSCTAGSGNATR